MRVTQLIYTKEFLKIASKHIFYPEIDYDVKKFKFINHAKQGVAAEKLLKLTYMNINKKEALKNVSKGNIDKKSLNKSYKHIYNISKRLKPGCKFNIPVSNRDTYGEIDIYDGKVIWDVKNSIKLELKPEYIHQILIYAIMTDVKKVGIIFTRFGVMWKINTRKIITKKGVKKIKKLF